MGMIQAAGKIVLPGFPVYKQETPMSCGAASVRMAVESLGLALPEAEVRAAVRTSRRLGTLPWRLVRGYGELVNKAGRALAIKQVTGDKAGTEAVVESLQKGLPVIVSFLCENKYRPGTLIGHYSVIYGADLDRKIFMLANPFYGAQEIGIDEFWKMSEFRLDSGVVPLSIKFGKAAGVLKPRTIFQLIETDRAGGSADK